MRIQKQSWVRRTQYVINRGFQLRYVGVLVGAAVFAALIIGGIMYYFVELNWAVQVQRGLNLMPEADKLLTRSRNSIFLSFFISLFLMGSVLSFWGLFLSHRVAGPVFALGRRMRHIVLMHDLITPLRLRDKDALQEVRDFFNETLLSSQRNLEEELDLLNSMSSEIQRQMGNPVPWEKSFRDILREFNGLKREKQKWLTPAPS